ncbi:hypothetical protein ABZ686_23355 [Streptomyces sp. NPDC006992]|uniref:hypothetical protein n=1 Tax=Streptomyces sp. NPDC006992 TaxID=3155601 RepID=UPI003400E00A
MLTALPPGPGAALVVLAFCLVSLGVGTVMTLTNSMVLAAVPPERAGAASAVSETGIELGALGVAVLGSVLTSVYRMRLDPVDGVPAAALETARETLGNALAAAHLGGEPGRVLVAEARSAFTVGVQAAGLAGAALLAVAAVLAWLLLRPRPGEGGGADPGPGRAVARHD